MVSAVVLRLGREGGTEMAGGGGRDTEGVWGEGAMCMSVSVCVCVYVHVVSTIVLLLDLEGGTERERERGRGSVVKGGCICV